VSHIPHLISSPSQEQREHAERDIDRVREREREREKEREKLPRNITRWKLSLDMMVPAIHRRSWDAAL